MNERVGQKTLQNRYRMEDVAIMKQARKVCSGFKWLIQGTVTAVYRVLRAWLSDCQLLEDSSLVQLIGFPIQREQHLVPEENSV